LEKSELSKVHGLISFLSGSWGYLCNIKSVKPSRGYCPLDRRHEVQRMNKTRVDAGSIR